MLDGPTAPLCPHSDKIQDSVQNIVEVKDRTQKILVNFMRAFHNCGNNKMIFSSGGPPAWRAPGQAKTTIPRLQAAAAAAVF